MSISRALDNALSAIDLACNELSKEEKREFKSELISDMQLQLEESDLVSEGGTDA